MAIQLEQFKGAAATIGNFDGVHLGHQQMISNVVKFAAEHKKPAIVICFEPQPLEFFSETPPPRIMTFREKLKSMQSLGIDEVVCLTFDEAFAAIKAEDFIKDILVTQLECSYLMVGEDFRFGFQRQGDVSMLKSASEEYGFEFHVMKTIENDHEKVSSSQIRIELGQGHLDEAAALMGRPYSMIGEVIEGDKRGREIGYPTANIDPERKVLPMKGVFAVKVRGLGKPLFGMANLGIRPTVDGMKKLLEVNIFDFNEDIYGKEIDVEFVAKIRDEEKFESLDALREQITQDELLAKNILMV